MNTLDSAAPFQSPSKLRKLYLAKHANAAATELADAVSSVFGVTASPTSSTSTVSASPSQRLTFRDRRMIMMPHSCESTSSPSKIRTASPASKGVAGNLLDRMTKLHAPDMLSPERSSSSSSAVAPWSGTHSTVSPASISHPHGNIRDASPLRMKSDASVTSQAPGSCDRTVLKPIHQARLPFQPSPLRSPAPVNLNLSRSGSTAGTDSNTFHRSNSNVTRRLFDLPTRPILASTPSAAPVPAAPAAASAVIDITPRNFLARLQANASSSSSPVLARKRKQPAENSPAAPAVTLDTFFSSSQSSTNSSASQLDPRNSIQLEPIVKQEFPVVVKQEPISEFADGSPATKRCKPST